jgi:hypothetical protein
MFFWGGTVDVCVSEFHPASRSFTWGWHNHTIATGIFTSHRDDAGMMDTYMV